MMLMNFSTGFLAIISIVYLLALLGVAWFSERSPLMGKLASHPFIYILSLGIYSSALTFYGLVGLAMHYGYGYLAVGLGFTATFLLVPVLLFPILKLTQNYQLSSLADLFSFRFRSRWAGILTCLFMLVGMLPLIAFQIKLLAGSVAVLTQQPLSHSWSFVFCVFLMLFSILFGTRHLSAREKRVGLLMAVVFESVVKLLVFVLIAGYVVYSIFGGFSGLNHWLVENKHVLDTLRSSIEAGPWRALLLSFFAAAVVMPHMFHMTFAENVTPRSLMFASWGAPLYLLIIALCVPFILWGGVVLNLSMEPDYYVLGIGLQSNSLWLSIIAYLGGLAAGSGLIIVSTIALSGMLLNHLILPIYKPPADHDIYRWLKLVRRTLTVIIILLGYIFYLLTYQGYSNNDTGLAAFIAMLQFLPGVLVLLYWTQGNKKGFIAGLLTGMFCWGLLVLLPLISPSTTITIPFLFTIKLPDQDDWHFATVISLTANTSVLLLVSLITKRSDDEKRAASLCAVNATQYIQRKEATLSSPREFIRELEIPLGYKMARKEVKRALSDLGFSIDERRAYALRRLREQIEVNLSGLLGPHVAHQMVYEFLSYQSAPVIAMNEDIYFMENHLESYETRLTGLAAELDSLRRYHRLTLQILPIGVCSFSKGRDVLLWNRAMEQITGITADNTVGVNLDFIEGAWQVLLLSCIESEEGHIYKQSIDIDGHTRWYNLHKATIGDSILINRGGTVILVEDITETYLLESQLIHSERLASIGRLAAGVAHEIGNPVTGIACLAQILREEWLEHDEIAEMSEQIIEQTKRISRIVHSLVNFSHAGEDTQLNAPISLRSIAQETINLLVLNKDEKYVSFQNFCDERHQVLGNAQRLTQVLINLLDNARDASEEGGVISIITRELSGFIEILIEDEGEGIPDEIKEQIFEPFFTTKEPGVGTGLGLSLVYSIIEDHHGKVSVKSPLDLSTQRGTCFSIILPKYVDYTMV